MTNEGEGRWEDGTDHGRKRRAKPDILTTIIKIKIFSFISYKGTYSLYKKLHSKLK